MAANAENPAPRVFIIHSPFVDADGRILAVDFDDTSKLLVLKPLTDPTQARQRFRVYLSGLIQSVAQGANGYATRVTVDGVTHVHLEPMTPGSKDQPWYFTWGPVPPPGGGPNGGDRYTVTADLVPRKDDDFSANVLTAPVDDKGNALVGVPLTVEPTDIHPDRMVGSRKLWFYYWLPGAL
jgi:hypothetical protein